MHGIKRFFTDKHGKVVLAQLPNTPLISWFVFTVAAHLVHKGPVYTTTRVMAFISLAIWSILEITSGASPFRRVLGGVILMLLIASLL